MRVAEGEHHVGRIRSAQSHLFGRIERDDLPDMPEHRRISLDLVREFRAGRFEQMAVRERTGARISVYQPPPGSNSITVMSGFRPKNSRVSIGMTVLIARLVRGRTPVAVHGFLQQRDGAIGWRGRNRRRQPRR